MGICINPYEPAGIYSNRWVCRGIYTLAFCKSSAQKNYFWKNKKAFQTNLCMNLRESVVMGGPQGQPHFGAVFSFTGKGTELDMRTDGMFTHSRLPKVFLSVSQCLEVSGQRTQGRASPCHAMSCPKWGEYDEDLRIFRCFECTHCPGLSQGRSMRHLES